jgi:hypothetical protein
VLQYETVMKKISLFLVVVFVASQSYAAIGSYDILWPRDLDAYFRLVNASLINTQAEAHQCSSFYKNIDQKSNFNINYALGYFDESYGVLNQQRPDYYSPSLDGISFDVIRNFLKAPCDSSEPRKLCGFQEQGSAESGKVVLTKTIQFLGKSKQVNLTLTHASASENYQDNKSILLDRQSFMTMQSEQNYFEKIGQMSSDLVMYNGHSRNGGGPDFKPPVLLPKTLHPNYPLYKSQRVGAIKMLNALKSGENKNQILAFISCYSKKHFLADILKINPKQRLIITEEANDYLTALLASMGYLEAVLQGQCGNDLDQTVKLSEKIKVGFTQFGMK